MGIFPIVAVHTLALSGTIHENAVIWSRLVNAAQANEAFVHNSLQLVEADKGGYRGVYYYGEADISPGDTVLKIPLNKMCICSEDNDNWAFDLAKKLEDRMLGHLAVDPNDATMSSNIDDLWFSLLPKREVLSSMLPIHWDEELLEIIGSHSMQVAVDAAFFARGDANGNDMISHCLDLVQTRTCRIRDDLRCLAPLFDCLNHHDQHNCAFEYEQGHLVVSAITKIRNAEELLINYGDASTKPSWRCLVSYGFVPKPGAQDDEAEVLLNDRRFVIREDEISEELAAMYCSVDRTTMDSSSATAIADALEGYRGKELSRSIRSVESFDAVSDKASMNKVLALELLNVNSIVVHKCITNLRQWAAVQSQEP